jgi:uncharacterized protein
MKVAITGATGLVGSRLVAKLSEQGHEVLILTRNASTAQTKFPQAQVVQYRPLESGDWQQAINGCQAVVNLAGEPIAEKKWTAEQKKIILDSREIGTQKIVEAISLSERYANEQAADKPQVLINASAIGYYGASETATFDETSPAGQDFLAEICQKWEAAAQKTSVRSVILRFGIVLGNGGALGKMIPAFKMFMGGPIGTGNQWFSWIHVDDVVAMILAGIQDANMSGTFNATAPQPVKMKELCEQLGKVMGRPSWMPVPGFVLETMLGEGATVVLDGQQVLPKAILDRGFAFQYSDLDNALKTCI